MNLNYVIIRMQSQLNGQEKKAITQYINDTLSKYEIFQKEKYEQGRFYEETIAGLRGELNKERQRVELLEEELREMKERYGYLKKQEGIFSMLKGDGGESGRVGVEERSRERQREKEREREQQREINNHLQPHHPRSNSLSKQSDTSLPRLTDMSSIISLDQLPPPPPPHPSSLSESKLRQILSSSQSYSSLLKQQNDQYQKQLQILTQHISSKDKKIASLQKELSLETAKTNPKINHTSRENKETSQYIKTLEKEKRLLEQNIQKCSQVVKESEEYYTNEIMQYQEQISSLSEYHSLYSSLSQQYTSLQESFKTLLKNKVEVDKVNAGLLEEIDGLKRGIEEDLEEITRKREDEKEQYEFSQRLIVETFEKKIEIMEEEWRETEGELKDKISFLIIKLEQGGYQVGEGRKTAAGGGKGGKFQGGSVGNLNSLASLNSHSKSNLTNLTNHNPYLNHSNPPHHNPPHTLHPTLQELSVCQSQSVSYRVDDSFRFDSASISRAIKENLIKPYRKVEVASKDVREVTPAKSGKKALMERTNLM